MAPDRYFLTTNRLGFRCWNPEDMPLALALGGDAEVTRFVGGPFSVEQVQAKLNREIENFRTSGVQYWPIFLLPNGDHVGCAGLRPREHREPGFEMGYYLRPAYWRMGLATDAARAVIHHAFDTLKASQLFAAHHPENTASGRVLETLGFRFSHEELYPPTGHMHRSYLLDRS